MSNFFGDDNYGACVYSKQNGKVQLFLGIPGDYVTYKNGIRVAEVTKTFDDLFVRCPYAVNILPDGRGRTGSVCEVCQKKGFKDISEIKNWTLGGAGRFQ